MNNQDLVNEIRQKIDIVDLISEYIPLVQKGKNYFGVCPFHNDTNPSMSVSREKQIYKCFSCGASGNAFNFIMEYDHIDFKEAIKILGEKAGVEVSGITVAPKSTKFDKYYDMYEIANKYYQNNINTKEGNVIMMSEEDYNSLMESLYLAGIPGMYESIIEGANAKLEDCEKIEWK